VKSLLEKKVKYYETIDSKLLEHDIPILSTVLWDSFYKLEPSYKHVTENYIPLMEAKNEKVFNLCMTYIDDIH